VAGKAYKVVMVGDNGHMYSALVPKEAGRLTYRVGSTTTPKYGPVFCFTTKRRAVGWPPKVSPALQPEHWRVLRVRKGGRFAGAIYFQDVGRMVSDAVRRIWSDAWPPNRRYAERLPRGTVLLKSVKVEAVVYDSESDS